MNEHENCQVESEALEKPFDPGRLDQAAVAYLAVGGMGCPRCATRVRNGLLALGGTLLAEVFLQEGLAAVACDPERAGPEDLVGAVAGSGHDGRHRYRAQVLALRPAAEALVLERGSWTWR